MIRRLAIAIALGCPWMMFATTPLHASNEMRLDIIAPQACYKEGDQICVQLKMTNLTQNVTGFQAFHQYNNTLLTYNAASSCYSKNSPPGPVSANCPETGPFPTHIQPISTSEVSPGQINLDGAAPFTGPGSNGTNADSLLATLCFTVNAGHNNASTNISFRIFTFNSELSFHGVPIPTTTINSATFTIDQEPPEIHCPPDVTVDCPSQVPPPDFAGGSTSDNCSGGTVTVTHLGDASSGNCQTSNVTILRGYQARDTAGNISTCTQTITIRQDSTPPRITSVPPTKFVDCLDQVPPPYTTVAQFIADGGEVTDTCNMTISLYQSFQQGTCPTLIIRIYRIYDECGNFSTFKDVIIVDDNTPPIISGANTSTAVDATCQATASLSITVQDNCGVLASNVSVNVTTGGNATYGPPSVIKTQVDPHTVHVQVTDAVSALTGCPASVSASVSAVDACGNTAGPTTYTATVTDNINPTIACGVVGGAVDGACQRLVTYSATIDDNCCVVPAGVMVNVTTSGSATFGSPNTTITQNGQNQVLVSGSILVSNLLACPATVTVTVNAVDCCNNPAAQCVQSANVTDNTPPTITCPPNVNVFADAGECSASNVNLGSPAVSDNCDGSPTIGAVRSDSQPLNAPYPSGVTSVTWTATDDCNNSASCVQTVTVQAKNLVAATIELKGVILSSPKARCIRFIPRNGASCGASVAVNVSFSGGVSGGPWAQGQVTIANADLQIDCGVWTSLCAKDEQHTLSDSSVLNDLGTTYQAATTLVLRGGDTDNDNDVDINDVTYFLSRFGTVASPNSCPWNGTRDADFGNNGVVFTEDYTFLSDNWQQFTGCCGAIGWPIVMPHGGHHLEHVAAGETLGPVQAQLANVISIPVSQAQAPEAWRADLNGDGLIDVEDVKLFERAHGLSGALSRAMQVTTLPDSAAVTFPEAMMPVQAPASISGRE